MIGGFTPQAKPTSFWVVVVSLLLLLPISYGSMPPSLGVILSNFIHPVYRLSTAPVSDETPLHRLAASDRQLRYLETKLAAIRQAIDSFCDGGLEPPQSLVDSLSSLSRELVDARRISSDLHGAIRPPSQRPGVSSHRQRFAAAAASPSVSWRQPYAFASDQPTSNSSSRSFRPGGWLPPPPPPIKGVGYQSKIRLMMSANPLQFSCYRTKGRATRRIVALPPWRCFLTTL